jgi:hypothetical protein
MRPKSNSLASEIARLATHLRELEHESSSLTVRIAREEKEQAARYKLTAKRDRLRRRIWEIREKNRDKRERLVTLKRIREGAGMEARIERKKEVKVEKEGGDDEVIEVMQVDSETEVEDEDEVKEEEWNTTPFKTELTPIVKMEMYDEVELM